MRKGVFSGIRSMNDRVFIDSNILVYCFDSANPPKKAKALSIIEELWGTSSGVLSLQVLKEFFVTVTEKLSDKMDYTTAKATVIDLLTWNMHYESPASFKKALDIMKRYRLSIWDANIVSAAVLSGCDFLYSEDLQHRQAIESIRIVNPFL